MTRYVLLPAVLALSLFGWNPDEQPNVNSRYTVESVHLSGKRSTRLSEATRRELEGVVGQRLDHSILDQIASRIKKELRVEGVSIHVAKGTVPEHVIVEFAVEGAGRQNFDIALPKGVYHSRQGWSGAVETTTTVGGNSISFGVVSDGDTQVERFAGVRGRIERNAPGTDRVKLRFDVESYHQQWNDSFGFAASTTSHFSPDLYRTRQNFQPSVTFTIAEPLTLTVGFSVERLEPEVSTLHTMMASAVVSNLRFHERWKVGESTEEVDAGYALRGAPGMGDFSYSRHAWNLNYRLERGHNALAVDFTAGKIVGVAPLYEHFVLGNSTTLRGWNKYDLDPLGGDRMIHGSVGYSYRGFQAFYDAGQIGLRDTETGAKQSAGVGFGHAGKEGFLIAVAFPLRGSHIEPMFIAGFNF